MACARCCAALLPFFEYDDLSRIAVDDLLDRLDRDLNLSLDVTTDHPCLKGDSYCEPVYFNNFSAGFRDDGFSLLHVNARSLEANFLKLKILLNSLNYDFDVIACSETWLRDATQDSYQLPGYEFISSHRDSKGGGAGIYIKFGWRYEVLDGLTGVFDQSHESLFLKIFLSNNKTVIVGCVYRSSSYTSARSLELFFDEFLESCLDGLGQKKAIICGDTNIDLIDNSPKTRKYLDLMHSAGFTPHITLPTRISGTSATCLDVIFSNLLENSPLPKIIIDDITDHFPVTCLFSISRKTYNNCQRSSYLINDYTLSKFRVALQRQNLIFENDNPDAYYSKLIQAINGTAGHCFVDFTGRPRMKVPNKLPWLSADLKKTNKTKNYLYKKYLLEKSEESLRLYKQIRNQLNSAMRRARKEYISNCLEQSQADSRKLWRILNNVVNYKPDAHRSIAYIQKQTGEKLCTPKEISTEFNKYFVSVGQTISNSLAMPEGKSYRDYLSLDYPHSMFLDPVTDSEVSCVFRSSLDKSSTDIDGLNSVIFAKVFDLIQASLTILFNLSFTSGIFPNGMKLAKVIPIYKKGKRADVSNYRPISIIPFLSKLLEKLFCSRLIDFLDNNHIISDAQYGYRKNRSTVLAAVDYYESITECLLRRQDVLSISLDLSKAFDSISHAILLEKLWAYGIRGLPHRWLASYLANRSQKTVICNISSEAEAITHGVPQGSVLGPILFLTYINDLTSASDKFKYIMYADDTTLLYPYDPGSNLSDMVNSELEKISDWLRCNKLSLNPRKTQSIVYSRTRGGGDCPLDLELDGVGLGFVSEVNILGITFDVKLNFASHLENIKKKLSKNLGILFRTRKFITRSARRLLFHSLIYSHFIGGIEVWGGAAQYLIDPLIRKLEQGLRYVEVLPRRRSVLHLYRRHSVLKLHDLYVLQLLQLMYKAYYRQLPGNINDRFSNFRINRVSRQSAWNLAVKKKTTRIQNLRPSVCGPYLWNNLHVPIRKNANIRLFKKKAKLHFLQGY